MPSILAMNISKEKNIIKQDIERWVKIENIEYLHYSTWKYLHWFMLFYPQFRNLFYYRINKHNKIISKILRIFYKPYNTLFIEADSIGGGLYIQHGFSTIITANTIGENCWINQQVTIGYGFNGRPSLGNNVRITAGAKIIGDIMIGDNTMIGANTVIVKDIPPNCTVVGSSAFIVKKNGQKVYEKV